MRRQSLWKARREAGRGLLRIWDAVALPVRRLRTRLFDLRRAKHVTVQEGKLPRTGKVAIYVIFQPDGVGDATLLACDWLARNGYAPLVVSNAVVSDQDRKRLQDHCWLLAVRPNRGYDFGAYRDGLWVLSSREVDPSRLILMNDSIWIPLAEDDRMMQALEAGSPGMSGAVFVAREGRSRRNAHFQSFLVNFDGKVARHPAFVRFWKRYPLCDARRVVLSEGEKGLSQAVLSTGLVTSPEPTSKIMLERLEAQDARTIAAVLRYAAYDNPADAEEGRTLVRRDDGSDVWRLAALDHMRRVLQRAQPMGAFVVAGHRLMGCTFLKKGNNLSVYPGTRWQYLRAMRDGVLPRPAPAILAEIEASRMDGRWTTDIKHQPTP